MFLTHICTYENTVFSLMYNCLCVHVLVGVLAVGHHTSGVDVESRGQVIGINHHFPLSMLIGFLVTALVGLAS